MDDLDEPARARPRFAAGDSIAMKIPAAEYERTVEFYRDVIGLPVINDTPGSLVLAFGDKQLWLDRIDHFERTEIWLEIKTDNAAGARDLLLESGVVEPDDVQSQGGRDTGFWVSAPNRMIHLVREE